MRCKKRIVGCLGGALILVICLTVWTICCEKDAHHVPDHTYVNIEAIADKEEWSGEDYTVLSEQTGLSDAALYSLWSAGRGKEVVALQNAYFQKVNIRCEPNTVISSEEYLVDESGKISFGMPIPCVEDGDILITNCSHVLGWRNGHAGIVIDAALGLVLEAQVLGSPSVITSLTRWECYPSFVVLRLEGVCEEERAQIAAYAWKYLLGVPYRLSAGINSRLKEGLEGRFGLGASDGDVSFEKASPEGTHCAHLIWYVYNQFGYDLDSDGGIIVTPRDIAESKLLFLVQKYGV